MTVLNTVEVIERGLGWSWPGFSCAIISIILIAFFIIYISELSSGECTALSIVTAIFFVISAFFFSNAKVKEQYNKYLVVFEDDTSINEVYENYNIIDREGIAFWITDIEGE